MVGKAPDADSSLDQPWQLFMHDRSLKKQLELQAIMAFLPTLPDKRCLLISFGGHDGALNWHLRAAGGDWEWGDVSGADLSLMAAFLEAPVLHIPEDNAPFPDAVFDCIVVVQVLNYLEDDQMFLGEMRRLLQPGGLLIVSVPSSNQAMLTNYFKSALSRPAEVYAHVRMGYTVAELGLALRKAQFVPETSGGYSRFFTELLELLLRFCSGQWRPNADQLTGQRAPDAAGKATAPGVAMRLYSLFFPVMRLLCRLDSLLPATGDNMVIVAARKGDD